MAVELTEAVQVAVQYAKAASSLGAAIAIGLGTLGPALGMGLVASKACENIGKYPENISAIRNAMYFGLILVETAALYAFLIALFLVNK